MKTELDEYGRTAEQGKQEIIKRINYRYLQTDGTLLFPNSYEGDVLRMVYVTLTFEREREKMTNKVSKCCGVGLRQDSIGMTCLKCGNYMTDDEVVEKKEGWEMKEEDIEKAHKETPSTDLKAALNSLRDKISKGELLCLEQVIKKAIREKVLEYDKRIRAEKACFFADCKAIGKCGYGIKREKILKELTD